MPTSQIEKFRGRIEESLKIMKRELSDIKGAEKIGDAINSIETLERTQSYQPDPQNPGHGTTGEWSLEMTRTPPR